jgi:hypothetical protein
MCALRTQDLIYADELHGYVKSGVLNTFQPAFFEVPGPNGEVLGAHLNWFLPAQGTYTSRMLQTAIWFKRLVDFCAVKTDGHPSNRMSTHNARGCPWPADICAALHVAARAHGGALGAAGGRRQVWIALKPRLPIYLAPYVRPMTCRTAQCDRGHKYYLLLKELQLY